MVFYKILIQTSSWQIEKYEAQQFSFTRADYLCFGIYISFMLWYLYLFCIYAFGDFLKRALPHTFAWYRACSHIGSRRTWLFKLFKLVLPQNVRMIFSPWKLLQIHLKKFYWKIYDEIFEELNRCFGKYLAKCLWLGTKGRYALKLFLAKYPKSQKYGWKNIWKYLASVTKSVVVRRWLEISGSLYQIRFSPQWEDPAQIRQTSISQNPQIHWYI